MTLLQLVDMNWEIILQQELLKSRNYDVAFM